jgi:hypothetical protein
MKVGFAIAGRHPGHYFLGEQVSYMSLNFSRVKKLKVLGPDTLFAKRLWKQNHLRYKMLVQVVSKDNQQ